MRANVAGGVLTEDHFVELVAVGGIVAGVLDNGQFTALLTDARGTPFAGPDGIVGLASPYGVRASHLGLAEVIDYTRLGWDPDLDVVRMGVRDYDTKLSQFLTPDPLYFEDLEQCQTSPLQCTLYGYAGGNPISFVDPTGMGFWGAALRFGRNLAATVVEAGATVVGGAIGAAGGAVLGAGSGPGAIVTSAAGAVGGAGLARGIVSPIADVIRGDTPSVSRMGAATVDGLTWEAGGRVATKVVSATFGKIRSAFAKEAGARIGAGGGPRKSPFNPTSETDNCVRCVTSLVDAVENGGFVLPAGGYPGPPNSWFTRPYRALQYITEQTGVTFGKASRSLGGSGDYVVFNQMKDGNPTHVLWARVRADGTSYFYEPQTARKVAESAVGPFQAHPIIYQSK